MRHPARAISADAIIASSLGASLSYAWWIVAFQIFTLAYAAAVVLKAPQHRVGAVGLATLLASSTFAFTAAVANAPLGAYALSGHNANGGQFADVTGAHVSAIAASTGLAKWTNYVFVLFAGLVVVDVANAVLILTVGGDEQAAAAAEKEAAPGAAKKVMDAEAV